MPEPHFTNDNSYKPNLFANRSDNVSIQFQVRDRDNDNVNISLIVRNRTLWPNGWVYGDWFEVHNWSMGDYGDMILSYSITEINENWNYYFNISDDSSCGKKRYVPPGAPQDYYCIEIPSKEYITVAIDWRFVNDTYIDNNSVNADHGDYSTVDVRDDDLYGLIKFNLSSIPSSAIIESANLSLYLNSTSATQDIKLYRVLQYWNESNVTWGNWYSSSNYNISSPSITGEIRSDYVFQYYNWSAIADVEYFHNNSDKNYGWLIKVTPGDNLAKLDSKEAAYASRRPVLYVTYSE